ncbi:hypothetical protein V493_01711 [Pseudogymnoascus sp. VKM F-4281 (FW-2241)]|nr:hypothetical protein V493_01711 [Pseudogymnoascus sp. VKM F-4281 (FW-2241)]
MRATAAGGVTGRRRGREEYEEGRSPPLGAGPAAARRAAGVGAGPGAGAAPGGAFGEGRDSEESVRAKKEEFLRLCDRAWDLFHS